MIEEGEHSLRTKRWRKGELGEWRCRLERFTRGDRRMSEYMGIYIERKRKKEKRRRDSMKLKDQRVELSYAGKRRCKSNVE